MAERFLYGPDGRRIRRSALSGELARPSWSGLLQPWRGETIASGLTPQRLVSILRSADSGESWDFLLLAEEMEERDLHYAAVLGTRKRAVGRIEPVVEEAPGGGAASEHAEAVRELVRRSGFRTLRKHLLDALGKGYAAVEIVWDRGARWQPARYEWRDPRWFRIDRDDGRSLRLLDERDPAEGTPLEWAKWIVHAPQIKSGLPIRGALARLAAIAWMCKAYALTDWTRFCEIFGQPWRVGKYHEDASEADVRKLLGALANLGTDAAAAIPEQMQVEFVSAGGGQTGQPVYRGLAEYLDRQVSKGVLGQTMTTDDGSSRSQAEVHDRVRQDICEDDAEELAETLNRELVRPFIDLNFGVQERYPRILLPVPDAARSKALLERLEALVPLGLEVSQEAARDLAGLPAPEAGAGLLSPPARRSPNPAPRPAANRAEALNRAGEDDGLLDELLAESLEGWQRVTDPLLQPVRELLEASASPEEFLAGLAAALGEMEDGPLRRALAAAAFAARGLGDARDEA